MNSSLHQFVDDIFEELGTLQAPPLLDEQARMPVAVAHHLVEQIGRHLLVEELGAGGFGTVCRAEQTKTVRREMAVKILKAGMDTREVIARFEAECL